MGKKPQERIRPSYEIRIISRGSELKKIGARAFMDFINPFVDEKAYLSIQKKATLKEEGKWLKKKAGDIDSGDEILLLLFINGKLAGNCDARRGGLANQKHNAIFGLAVSKEWRGCGFGELLLRKGIAVAKKKLRPHRMWIEHDSENRIAARLYKKVGFVEVARLRHYTTHYGKYTDNCIMEYSPLFAKRKGAPLPAGKVGGK
ncbi:MAG: N-acetyltransferase [Candidatus Micrarchaeia archaeon]|jgi:ribosomal protein S18 acetylase RimI-like enzyme